MAASADVTDVGANSAKAKVKRAENPLYEGADAGGGSSQAGVDPAAMAPVDCFYSPFGDNKDDGDEEDEKIKKRKKATLPDEPVVFGVQYAETSDGGADYAEIENRYVQPRWNLCNFTSFVGHNRKYPGGISNPL